MNLTQTSIDLKTKFETSYIVDILRKNLAQHTEEYANAMKVYEEDVAALLRELAAIADLQADTPTPDLQKVSQIHSQLYGLQKPVDATKMYEQYINILSQSKDEFLILDIQDANAIINDSWDWAVKAKVSNSFYAGRAA